MNVYHYTTVPAEPMEGRPGVTVRWIIGANVGAPNFSARVIEIEPDAATEHHAHPWEHEVFVLDGWGVVVGQSGEMKVSAGACVYIPPDELHQFRNVGDSFLRMICVVPHMG